MKEIFMPSMDELYQMQDKGANVYKYILVKAIESIICKGVNYPDFGIFENTSDYFRENPEIARAVCSLYPDEMVYSDVARNDINLCVSLINGSNNKVSNLDYISRFDNNIIYNSVVLRNVILLLEKELSNNPKYRFDYGKEDSCEILDIIFNREINSQRLMFILGDARINVVKSLVNIEPTYALSLPSEYFSVGFYNNNEYIRNEYLNAGIANYADRYGITGSVGCEYYGKDILTNPDKDVKKLLKCINDRNKKTMIRK